MDSDDKLILVVLALGFFTVVTVSFLAFLKNTGTSLATLSEPLLVERDNETGRIVNIQPTR